MRKFLTNLKKYSILLIGAILPYLIFLMPVYSEIFIDGVEETVINYSFYNLLNYETNTFFTIVMTFMIIFTVVNIMLFIILMIDNYKIKTNKDKFCKVALINNIAMLVGSVLIVIFAIIKSTKQNANYLVYHNIFQFGSIVLLVCAIICLLVLIKNLRIKNNERTF